MLAICLLRNLAIPALRDLADVFSLIVLPFKTTNPSVVIIPVAIAEQVIDALFDGDYSRAENVCREAKQYSATLISDLEQIKKMSQGHV